MEIMQHYRKAVRKAKDNAEKEIRDTCNRYAGTERILLAEADNCLVGHFAIKKIAGFEDVYLFTRDSSWNDGWRSSGVVFEDRDKEHLDGLIKNINKTHIIGGINRDYEATDYPQAIWGTTRECKIENPVINWFCNAEDYNGCYQICGINFNDHFVKKLAYNLKNGKVLE